MDLCHCLPLLIATFACLPACAVEVTLGSVPPGSSISVSPDGQRAAFVIRRAGKLIASVDGREHEPYDWIVMDDIHFSADGRHTAYHARLKDRHLMVVDGKHGPAYDAIKGFVVGPTGRILYAARKGNLFHAVIDGVQQKGYPRVKLGAIGGEGGRCAYVAGIGDTERIVVDGQEGPEYDLIVGVTLSPDGRRVAYRGTRGGRWYAIIDDKEGPAFDDLSAIAFSPDGKHVAYTGLRGDQQFAVIDGMLSPPQSGATTLIPPTIASNGRSYAAFSGSAGQTLLLDSKAAKTPLRPEPSATFSADGKRLAYIARDDQDRAQCIVDGRTGRAWDNITDVTFSPDGKRLAYRAARQRQELVVIDGVAGEPFEAIQRGSLAFSPDGRHAAWVATQKDKAHLFIDGASAGTYDRILLAGPLAMTDTAVRFIAVRDGQLLRVELPLPR